MNRVIFIKSLPCLLPKVTVEELLEGSNHPGFTSAEQYVMRELANVISTHKCQLVEKSSYVNERDYLHALAYYCTQLVLSKFNPVLYNYLSIEPSSGLVPVEELNICWFALSSGVKLDETSLHLFFTNLTGLISQVRNCHGNRWKVKEILGHNVFLALEFIAMITNHFSNMNEYFI